MALSPPMFVTISTNCTICATQTSQLRWKKLGEKQFTSSINFLETKKIIHNHTRKFTAEERTKLIHLLSLVQLQEHFFLQGQCVQSFCTVQKRSGSILIVGRHFFLTNYPPTRGQLIMFIGTGCPGRAWSHPPWRWLRNRQMWYLRTWLSGQYW